MPVAVLRHPEKPGMPAVVGTDDSGLVPLSWFYGGWIVDNDTSPVDARAECAATVAAAQAAAEAAAQDALPAPPAFDVVAVTASATGSALSGTVTLPAFGQTGPAAADYLTARLSDDRASLALLQTDPTSNATEIGNTTARISRTVTMLAGVAAGTAVVNHVQVLLPMMAAMDTVDVTVEWPAPFTPGAPYYVETPTLPAAYSSLSNCTVESSYMSASALVDIDAKAATIPAGTVLNLVAYQLAPTT